MSKPNILVLGSEGAIGTSLVKTLINSYKNPNIIRHSRTNVFNLNTPLQERSFVGDLLEIDFTRSIFNECNINIVIFCAGVWNGLNKDARILDENVSMFSNVLSSLTASVSHFIYLSSSAVYPSDDLRDSQVDMTLPSSTYGKSKIINETLLLNRALTRNFSATIYRPFHVVAPHEKHCPGRSHITTDFTHRYIELNEDFEWGSLPLDNFIPFLWVDDLCQIITENVFNKNFSGRVFNISSPVSFSIADLAYSVAFTAKKHGLSSKDVAVRANQPAPLINKIPMGIESFVKLPPKRSILEVVEKFVIERYGLKNERFNTVG